MSKILIIGFSGQLGREFVNILSNYKKRKFKLFTGSRENGFDITNFDELYKNIKEIKPQQIINCAAILNNDENEKNPEKLFKVNTLGVKNLAFICSNLKCNLIHFSTDFVFDGNKSIGDYYYENDIPNPLMSYGISKLAGEYYPLNVMDNGFGYVFRISSVYGKGAKGKKNKNFIYAVLNKIKNGEKELKIVNDVYMTTTYSKELAQRIVNDVIDKESYKPGLYHLVNEGALTQYDFAKDIIDILNIKDVKLTPISYKDIKYSYKRPNYTPLNSNKIRLLSFYKSALTIFLKEL